VIIELAALTTGIALAVFAFTLGGLVLVTRVLRALDDSEPAWWPAFERDLADYVKGRLHPSA
jgi:hypothetical protein